MSIGYGNTKARIGYNIVLLCIIITPFELIGNQYGTIKFIEK